MRLLTEQDQYTDVSARSAFLRERRSGLERFTIDWTFVAGLIDMDLIERFQSVRDAFWGLPSPARLVLGVVLGLTALILLAVVLRLAIWWGSAGQATARLEPRIAQMLGF